MTPDLNLNSEAGQSHTRIWKSGDPLVHAMDFVISSSADKVPEGSGRVVLEQVTIPPGGTLAPQTANPLMRMEVGSGTLGLTLEGDRLPYHWKSGREQKLPYGGDYFPQLLAPGTTMRMRNAGETPLILYRLTLLPAQVDTPVSGSPVLPP